MVVDVSNSPSFADREVMDFFQTSTRTQLQFEQDAAEMHQTIEHLEDAVRSHQHIFAENGRLRHEVEVLEGSLAAAERRTTEIIVRGGGRAGAGT